jgi:hypothetical protein
VKGTHIAELRSALNDVYTALRRTGPTFTDPALPPGATIIKALHIMELRAAILALE